MLTFPISSTKTIYTAIKFIQISTISYKLNKTHTCTRAHFSQV